MLLFAIIAYANQLVDTSAANFDLGYYRNTNGSNNNITLSLSNTSGFYHSQIFNINYAQQVTWNSLTWTSTTPANTNVSMSMRVLNPYTADSNTMVLIHFDVNNSADTCTLSGGCALLNNTGTNIATGVFANSINTSGTSALIYNASGWNDITNGCMESWIYDDWTTDTGDEIIWSSYQSALTNGTELRYIHNNEDWYWYYGVSGGWTAARLTNNNWNDNEWHHIAYCWNMTALRSNFYIDGTQVNSVAITSGALPFQSGIFRLGARSSGGSAFDGRFDEFRITNGTYDWNASALFSPSYKPFQAGEGIYETKANGTDLLLRADDSFNDVNGINPLVNSSIDFATGYINQGFNITSTSDRLCYDSNLINPNKGTVEMWVNSYEDYSTANTRYLWQYTSNISNPSKNTISLMRWSDRVIYLEYYNSAGTNNYIGTGALYSWKKGEWHHIAATWDNSTSPYLQLFLDGQFVNARGSVMGTIENVGITSNMSVGGGAYIPGHNNGCNGANPSYTANAILDEVTISNYSKTIEELNYWQGRYKTSPQTNLTQLNIPSNSYPQYRITEYGNTTAKPEVLDVTLDYTTQTKIYWVKTYINENKSRSFFAVNDTARIKAKTELTPYISLLNSSGDQILSSANMTNETPVVNNIATWYYDFVVNQTGWFDVNISGTVFPKAFYADNIWRTNWSDKNGNNFPFRIPLNISETNATERYFEPVDINLNFTYNANANSIRVAFWNGSNLIEIPSQVYNTATSGGYTISGNVVFLASSSEYKNNTYYVYYSRSNLGQTNYSTDLNVTNTSNLYEIQNTEYRIDLNASKGGLMQDIYSKKGGNSNLAGFNPMQLSPEIKVGPYTYRVSDLTTPIITLTNGSVISIFKTTGEVGTMNFNITYKFYSHAPYFILETNITPKASETWDYYLDQQMFLKDGNFSKVNWKNSSGIYEDAAVSGDSADKTALGNLNWMALYHNGSSDSFGSIFLTARQTQAYTPNVAFYDDSSYEYYKRTLYVGAVTTNDGFYSKSAIALWRAMDNYEKLNNTDNLLRSPLNYTFAASETYDLNNPLYTSMNYTPYTLNDTQNVTCYSYWTDNLEIDYAAITINSSAYNNYSIQQINLNESWANYTFLASNLEAGQVICNITVYDIAGLSNTSRINFSVSDATPPYFISITNNPSDNATLDPGITINITANMTEYTNISAVILQYKNSSGMGWQNITMNLSSNIGYNFVYISNFTPTTEGIWSYRVFVNDTLGNANTSQITNLTAYYDWTWTTNTNDFGAISGVLANNVTVGYINITNTGDRQLNFKMTSNWDDKNLIYFNESAEGDSGFNFGLNSGSSVNISAAVTAKSTERSDSLTMTIDAINSSASPTNNLTNATVVSYASGPFLLVTITNYNASVTQGDTGIFLRAKVQNKGNETASNVWLAFILPTGWSNTSNILNNSMTENLTVDSIFYNETNVSIGTSAATGTQTLTVTAGSSENKTGTSSVSVVVVAASTTTTTTTTTSSSSGGGGGGSAGGGSGVTAEQKEKLFQTEQTYELVRGKEQNFILTVENPFDGVLQNVTLKMEGFLAQYLKIANPHIDKIPLNGSYNFIINIEAPKYLTKGKHDITFTITALVNKSKRIGNTTLISYTTMKENRQITLMILEVPKADALNYSNDMVALVNEMKESGLNTNEVALLLSQASSSLQNKDYEKVKAIYETIKDRKEKAFSTISLLGEVSQKMRLAEYNGLKIPKTERLYFLAKAALERGDYETALRTADDSKVTYALETVGKFNLIYFVKNNWPKLSVAAISFAILLYVSIMFLRFNLVSGRLRSLKEEEGVLLGLIKEIQKECFERGKLSMEEYFESLIEYDNKLSNVIQETIRLETAKSNVFKIFKKEFKRLMEERKKLLELIRETQDLYLHSGKIESRTYENRMKSYAGRLAKIEERLAGLEAKKVTSQFKIKKER